MKIKCISDIKIELQKQSLTEHGFENVELKRDWSRSYGEKISMLCNGNPEDDCFLIVGVEDDGKMSGHDDAWLTKNLEVISQHCNQYLDPSISLLDITTEDINGSKVVICHVKCPGVVVKWERYAYRGKGTTKKQMTPEEIMELNLSLPGITDFSKQKISFIPNEALTKIFCEKAGLEYDDRVLERYSLSDTRAGGILFGETKYRIVEYNEDGDVLRNEVKTGLLGFLSDKTYEEVRNFYSNKKVDSERITDSMLREAFGNCVGHAAYKENDGEIILEMHPHRMVLSNLAYEEYSSLANKWFSSAHKSPNSFLMESLRLGRWVDELGRGKKKLLSECLVKGLNPPVIAVSEAGRFKRWSLQIDFEDSGERFRNLRDSLFSYYDKNKEKSLIAYALVLWSDKPFSEIKKYFDTHESKIAAEIISDLRGPVYYWEDRDKIVLHRWVKILIEEGKASKEFTQHEENELYKRSLELHNRFYGGLITPSQFRELAHLSSSQSDKSLTSRVLKKWELESKLIKLRRGTYKFTDTTKIEIEKAVLLKLLSEFNKKQDGDNIE